MLGSWRGMMAVAAVVIATPGQAGAAPMYSVTALTGLSPNAVDASGQVGGGIPIYDKLGNQTAYHAGLYSDGTLVDLGGLGGTNTYFGGINDAGQVAGTGQTPGDQNTRAFLYAQGVLTSLGTLGGASSTARAINASGQVTGSSNTASGAQHAFLATGGALTDLGTLGGYGSYGYALNASGMVTGDSDRADGRTDAFLYTGGLLTDLGSLGGFISSGTAINAAGQVAGYAYLDTSEAHAVLFSGGQVIDLGTRGRDSGATAINDSGQVIGYARTGASYDFFAPTVGFLYSNGVTIQFSFGSGSSAAEGLNNLGQVVGTASDPATGGQAAFLYSGGSMYHLDSLVASSDPLAGQLTLTDALAISDSGRIVSRGCSGGLCGSFLLTPVDEALVPEPGSLVLLAGAALAAVARRRTVPIGPPPS